MARCADCGKELSWNQVHYGCCVDCFKAQRRSQRANPVAAHQAKLEREERIDAILLTTETAPNLPIKERIEIVTAECAFGMNIFKDLFAGVRDIVGGRSKAVQKTMRDARKTTLYELKKEAHAVGANAVVGVDLDYVEMSAAASMVLLVASGTAVVIDREAV